MTNDKSQMGPKTERTPGPWEVREGTKHYQFDIVANMDGEKKRIFIDNHYGNAEANAAFIVKACNLHDELVRVCQSVSDSLICMRMELADPQAGEVADLSSELLAIIAKAQEA